MAESNNRGVFDVFVEIDDKWVKVAEVTADTWQDAVKSYRAEYNEFLDALSEGHADTVNLEAEEHKES